MLIIIQTFVILCLAPTKPRVTPSDKMSGVNVYAVAWFIGISIGVILLFLGKNHSIILSNSFSMNSCSLYRQEDSNFIF